MVLQYVTLTELKNNARADVGLLASQMASRMDRFMWERYQQVLLLASGFHSLDYNSMIMTMLLRFVSHINYLHPVQRTTLDSLMNSYPVYSFFGIVNMTGVVVASGKGMH